MNRTSWMQSLEGNLFLWPGLSSRLDARINEADVPATGKNGLPVLDPSWAPTSIPPRAAPFSKVARRLDEGVDMKDVVVHFYEHDREFLCIFEDMERWSRALSHAGAVIGPDLTIYEGMPLRAQIKALRVNLALSSFLGRQGIPLIPNARCGDEILFEEYLSALPEGCPLAIGVTGFAWSKLDKMAWIYWVHLLREAKRPPLILVVSESGRFLEEAFPSQKFLLFPSTGCPREGGERGNVR